MAKLIIDGVDLSPISRASALHKIGRELLVVQHKKFSYLNVPTQNWPLD
jgi:hypothetical protein